MFDKELLNKKYYSNLNLYGGELKVYHKFGNQNFPSNFLYIVYTDKFFLKVLRCHFWFKPNEYKIIVKNYKDFIYNSFDGGGYKTEMLVMNIKKSELLSAIQHYINFYYKRLVKLSAFT